ncbi:large ribosomal subunit protein uL2m [Gastrolobium bilobum]|uniref:large ribosomal subunit protein uL2m n=1 Tax=Gastrolobium bilobum TaxID=150636 RepID=UPI002AB2105F|nr:large ribosomal subunit protein uL2m [Gastrolobium bilobum]
MSGVKRAMRQFTFGAGKTAGRNSSGRITSFHRGGGAKRLQRTVDLKRNTASSMGVVERIEYDPNRSSRIALVRWVHGIKPPHGRTSSAAGPSPPPRRVLELDSAAAAAANIRGVLAFNSMLPPVGTTARDVFFSAFSSKRKGEGSESLSSLGLPRIAVAAAKPPFFAPRVRGEEALQIRNWKRNSDVWAHRNKRKAAISWHSIAR